MNENQKLKAPRYLRYGLRALACILCGVWGCSAAAKSPTDCVQALLPSAVSQDALDDAADFVASARTYLKRSETRERKIKVAQDLIAVLDERFGIQGFIHPYAAEGTVLVGIRAPQDRKCSDGGHWISRIQCHVRKEGYLVGLIVSSGSHLESQAWVLAEPNLLALPMDSILMDRAGSVFAHEWVHVRSNLNQAQRELGKVVEKGPLVPVHVLSRRKLKSATLERSYGGAAKNSEGHWLEENDAFLKEGRFELAYARAMLQKLQEIAPNLTRTQIRKWSKQIRKRLDLAAEYFRDFEVFFDADVALLNRFLRNLRVESPDGKRLVLGLRDGSKLDFSMAGVRQPREFLILQRDHLVELAEIHARSVLRLREARVELKKLARR